MGFNPEQHYRKFTRLTDYDYSSPGAYFITICTRNRQHCFGDVVDGKMLPSPAGEMVAVIWKKIPAFYPTISLGAHIVMPNHFYGILHIYNERCVGADHRVCPGSAVATFGCGDQAPGQTQPIVYKNAPTQRVSLPVLVQRFKALTTKYYVDGVLHHGWPAFDRRLWQRNYHEHVIRNESAYLKIAEYIEANPQLWLDDVYHKPLQNDPIKHV